MSPHRLLLISLLFVLFNVSPAALYAQTETSIEDLKAGVVKIRSTLEGRTRVGTGIIVNLEEEDTVYIVTASHVIEGDLEPKVTFYSDPNDEFTAKVLGLEGGDPKGLAALLVKGVPLSGIQALRMDANTTIYGGERVTLIGFPRVAGVPWAVTTGTIAGQKGSDLSFSGSADEGNSGGPLLIDEKVIGVVTQMSDQFGYASPSVTTLYALRGWGIRMEYEPGGGKAKNLPDVVARLQAELKALKSRGLEKAPEAARVESQFESVEAQAQKAEPVQEARIRSYDASKRLQREIIGKDGAPMILIPEGEFPMGSNDGKDDEHPVHRVRLDAFYMDQYEVTISRYAKFFQGTERQQPAFWETVNLVRQGDRPIVGISWYDANAYCNYYRKRLPTEAEWEKAARGTDGRKYPWGNESPNSRLANFNNYNPLAWKNLYSTGLKAVGSYETDKSPYGIYDMAGNVWELTADWYGRDYYQYSPGTNPEGPPHGKERVRRGGAWSSSMQEIRLAHRGHVLPSLRLRFLGFRCAQNAE